MIEQSRLKDLLEYDPCTGVFIRKIATGRCGRHKAGLVIGTVHAKGYLRARVDGSDYLLHRLAWFYEYGEWPDGEIDHINQDKSDNRIENLRIVTSSENHQNRFKQKNNTSGCKGVYLQKKTGKWVANIRHEGKTFYLGYYEDKNIADSAYRMAAAKFHTFNPLAAI